MDAVEDRSRRLPAWAGAALRLRQRNGGAVIRLAPVDVRALRARPVEPADLLRGARVLEVVPEVDLAGVLVAAHR